jgi:hypothetical protein
MFRGSVASKSCRMGNANAVYMRRGITSPDVTSTSSVTIEAGVNLESQSGAIPCPFDVSKIADARPIQFIGRLKLHYRLCCTVSM